MCFLPVFFVYTTYNCGCSLSKITKFYTRRMRRRREAARPNKGRAGEAVPTNKEEGRPPIGW